MARRPNQPALYELIRDRAALILPGAPGRGAVAPGSAGAAASTPPTTPAAAPVGAGASAAQGRDTGVVRPTTAPNATGIRPSTAAPATSPVRSPSAVAAHAAGASTGPPLRVLRVPIGYVWIAAGAALLVAVIAYVAGFNHASAREASRRASQADAASGTDGLGGAGIADPLVSQPEPGRGGTRGGKPDDTGAKAADKSGARPRAGEGGTGGTAGQAGTGMTSGGASPPDPRQKGWHYFVVAHPSISRTGEMVQFLRANGLDAHVVRDHNGDLRKVIVLPGFARQEDRSSPQVKAFRAKLLEVGLKWEKAARGNQNFGKAYAEPFTG